MFNHQTLKTRHRAERENYPENLSMRVHRALSWLDKSEQSNDDDSKFLFLWISFNAAYAQEFDEKHNFAESQLFKHFLSKLIHLDQNKYFDQIVWQHYSGAIRMILDNEFILKDYWDYQRDQINEDAWKHARSQAKIAANTALGQNNTLSVLTIVFSRLYVLRNQLIHGGATYASSANRNQLRDCTSILETLVPAMISIMMDHPNTLWGEPIYPMVKS